MITFNIITVLPKLIEQHLSYLPYNRAQDLGVAQFNIVNLRDYSIDKRGTVDDKMFGGGVGMVLRIEPIYNAIQDIINTQGKQDSIILLSPSGEKFTQEHANTFSRITDNKGKNITLICGRYEGVDHRVEEHIATCKISIGDFVLSGGELPALTVIEATLRLLPGVLEQEATYNESHSRFKHEHPCYTRPQEFNGWKVPEVLLSGNHAEIEKWKLANSDK
ncbi:tRNA (guanosine(37)-N1)-methyltransferase TrmD [candidate division WWE3 bacterium]|uniref:tRNA (guanine-N(1)-)-methyltransferase n=1 Tax=candidate division WWE3 bacterium TaxID=2053526 RepID=A0A955J1V8_UNCKA|nr:tRNA (guanosine(37)-N1)-methyltransferase TrmD [candidate division WWE3 bacterium]